MINSINNRDELWRRFAVAAPYLWLLVFFLAPFAIILKISLADPILAQPPYSPSFESDGTPSMTLGNYGFLLSDNLYAITYLRSVVMALITTVLCLLLGFPMAYGIARSPAATRNILLLLIILPFWISFLLRVYAWMGLMNTHGAINTLLLWLGLIEQPLKIMYTDFATAVGLVYSYLPFMILPLYATLERMDIDLIEAAQDLVVFLDEGGEPPGRGPGTGRGEAERAWMQRRAPPRLALAQVMDPDAAVRSLAPRGAPSRKNRPDGAVHDFIGGRDKGTTGAGRHSPGQ